MKNIIYTYTTHSRDEKEIEAAKKRTGQFVSQQTKPAYLFKCCYHPSLLGLYARSSIIVLHVIPGGNSMVCETGHMHKHEHCVTVKLDTYNEH